MASRSSWPGNVVFGEEGTQALITKLPGGWLGYEAEGSPPTVTTSDTDVVAVTVTVPADRFLKISVSGSISDSDNDAVGGELHIECDGVDIGRIGRHPDLAEASMAGTWVPDDGRAAGSHIYTLVGSCTSGEFTFFGTVRILVEDIGPASS